MNSPVELDVAISRIYVKLGSCVDMCKGTVIHSSGPRLDLYFRRNGLIAAATAERPKRRDSLYL